MPQDLTDDKSTLVQVMAWCHQATSHYLNQCWPRSPRPYGVTRPQWVNSQLIWRSGPVKQVPNLQMSFRKLSKTGYTDDSPSAGCWVICPVIIIPPHFNEVERGVYWFRVVRPSVCPSVRPSVRLTVRPSVCGQNGVRSVTSTILAGSISYLHI